MSIQFEIRLRAERFFQGEEIAVDLLLTNGTEEAVLVPALDVQNNSYPTFRLLGPGRARAPWIDASGRSGGAGATPHVLELGPGEPAVHTLLLDRFARPRRPGIYTIEAQLPAGDRFARSAPVRFTVERAASSAGWVSGSRDATTADGLYTAWLVHGDGLHAIYRAAFSERPADGHASRRRGAARALLVSPAATDPVAPFSATSPGRGGPRWIAWREGFDLCAHPFGAHRALRAALGSSDPVLVRPALAASDGSLHVLVVARERDALRWIRFRPPEPARGPAPGAEDLEEAARSVRGAGASPPTSARAEALSVRPEALSARGGAADVEPDPDAGLLFHPPEVWGEAALPARPQGITATFDARSELRLCLTSERNGQIHVHHGRAGEPIPPHPAMTIAGGALLPDTDPALFVDGQGQSRVAILFTRAAPREGGNPALLAPRLCLAEVRLGPQGAPLGPPSIRELGELESAPEAGAVAHWMDLGGDVKCDWAVWTSDGWLLGGRDGDLVRRPMRRGPALPLQLVSTASGARLLSLDPTTGPALVNIA